MTTIVISQPMFFPWIGLFEQIRLADIYIHYDDVQIPQGRSFINRVQIKTINGCKWLTVPISHSGLQMIKDVRVDETSKWREKHVNILRHSYSKSPYFAEMIQLVHEIYSLKTDFLNEINIYAIEKVCEYFSLNTNFKTASHYPNQLHSSEKLYKLVSDFGGTRYLTGWGAKNYLDHSMFERNGIKVDYMDYEMRPYAQLFGEFTPYVSILDLIANKGKMGKDYLCSGTKYWRDFCSG